MIVINGENKLLGRMCSDVASNLLKNDDKIIIVNARNVLISGKKEEIYKKYDARVRKEGKGNPSKNPVVPRYPDRIVKRCVRGMLPRNARGVSALKRLTVFIDTPAEYNDKVAEAVKKPSIMGISLEQLSIYLGSNLKRLE